jgi:hypothetical protein
MSASKPLNAERRRKDADGLHCLLALPIYITIELIAILKIFARC